MTYEALTHAGLLELSPTPTRTNSHSPARRPGGYVRRERHAREEERDVRIVDPSRARTERVLGLLRM